MRDQPDDHVSTAASLPAGSYDADKLDKGLTAAAKAKDEDRADAQTKAIDAARAEGSGTDHRDPSLLPGHRFHEVENRYGGKERIQVWDPNSREAKRRAEEPEAAPPARETAEDPPGDKRLAPAEKAAGGDKQ